MATILSPNLKENPNHKTKYFNHYVNRAQSLNLYVKEKRVVG